VARGACELGKRGFRGGEIALSGWRQQPVGAWPFGAYSQLSIAGQVASLFCHGWGNRGEEREKRARKEKGQVRFNFSQDFVWKLEKVWIQKL
jgi:hypothetical protein